MPMMFGRKLKRRIGARVFDGAFGGYPVRMWRLEKKIGNRRIWLLLKKNEIFSISYFFTKSPNPYRTTSKRIIKPSSPNPQ
jgi:hypothetical protein